MTHTQTQTHTHTHMAYLVNGRVTSDHTHTHTHTQAYLVNGHIRVVLNVRWATLQQHGVPIDLLAARLAGGGVERQTA